MGWQARSREKRKQTWGIVSLSYRRCEAASARLEKCLDHFGLKPAPGSDLDRMIREVRWLSSFGADPYTRSGAVAADPARADRAMVLYDQVERIGFTLQWAREIDGADAKARWVRKRIDRCIALDSVAQDYLFEMEMAAHMARWRDTRVAFEEPDIAIYNNEGGKMVFACKRPRSTASVAGALDDARAQIADVSGEPVAFILVGMDAIFHQASGVGAPIITHKAPTPEALERLGQDQISMVEASAASEIRRVFDASADTAAIIFCGMMVGTSDDPPAVLFFWVHRANSNPRQPLAEQVARATMRMIFPPRGR